MSKTALFPLLSAMLACGATAAFGQAPPSFPDGPGKDTVVAVLRRLPRHQPGARRLHAGRLEHDPEHDAEHGRAGRAGAMADRHHAI